MRVPAFVLRRIQKWSDRYRASREPDFYIGGKEDPYMIRWWVIPRNKWFNLYMHQIVKSDRDEALHDHPWLNVSLLVHGQYDEHTPRGISRLHAGELRGRRATASHRLALVPQHKGKVVTLFFTGPVVRHWGFHCPQGWRHWHDFIGYRDAQTNVVGRGCGEMDVPPTPGGKISFFRKLQPSTEKRPDVKTLA